MKNQNITFSSAYETPLSSQFSKAYSSFPLEIESKLCIAHFSCGTKVPQTNIIHKARENNTSPSLTVPSLHKRVLHNELIIEALSMPRKHTRILTPTPTHPHTNQ